VAGRHAQRISHADTASFARSAKAAAGGAPCNRLSGDISGVVVHYFDLLGDKSRQFSVAKGEYVI